MVTEPHNSAEAMIKRAAKDVNTSIHEVDMDSLMSDIGHRVEHAVKRALATVQTQSKAYLNAAEDQIDTAQHYVADRVRAKPVTALAAALGAGVLVGLLLSSGRKH